MVRKKTITKDEFGNTITSNENVKEVPTREMLPVSSKVIGGTKFLEFAKPQTFAQGLESNLTPEALAKREEEKALINEQLVAQQDATAQETIGLATQQTTLKGAVEAGMRTLNQGRERKEIFTPIRLFLQESKAVLKSFAGIVGLGKFGKALSSAEITSRYDQTIRGIEDALDLGGDPLNAEQMLQDIEQDLAQAAGVIQTESKYDVGALIDGRLTDDQVKLADLRRKINFLRMRIRMQSGVVR